MIKRSEHTDKTNRERRIMIQNATACVLQKSGKFDCILSMGETSTIVILSY